MTARPTHYMLDSLASMAKEFNVELPAEGREKILSALVGMLCSIIDKETATRHHPLRVIIFLLDCIRRENAVAPDRARIEGMAAIIDRIDNDDGWPRCPVLQRIDYILRALTHDGTRWLAEATLAVTELKSGGDGRHSSRKAAAASLLRQAIAEAQKGAAP